MNENRNESEIRNERSEAFSRAGSDLPNGMHEYCSYGLTKLEYIATHLPTQSQFASPEAEAKLRVIAARAILRECQAEYNSTHKKKE